MLYVLKININLIQLNHIHCSAAFIFSFRLLSPLPPQKKVEMTSLNHSECEFECVLNQVEGAVSACCFMIYSSLCQANHCSVSNLTGEMQVGRNRFTWLGLTRIAQLCDFYFCFLLGDFHWDKRIVNNWNALLGHAIDTESL